MENGLSSKFNKEKIGIYSQGAGGGSRWMENQQDEMLGVQEDSG